MKLKNFTPRPMREVEYFGQTICIPAEHEWVAMEATKANGEICSFSDEPEYIEAFNGWGCDAYENTCQFIGTTEPISTADAANSLRHYPTGEEQQGE